MSDSIIEDAVEALTGAIHADSDLRSSKLFISDKFFDDRRPARALSQGDPITELRELCERKKTECERQEKEKIVDRDTLFLICLEWQVREAVGIGKSRREAERQASAVILDDSKHP